MHSPLLFIVLQIYTCYACSGSELLCIKGDCPTVDAAPRHISFLPLGLFATLCDFYSTEREKQLQQRRICKRKHHGSASKRYIRRGCSVRLYCRCFLFTREGREEKTDVIVFCVHLIPYLSTIQLTHLWTYLPNKTNRKRAPQEFKNAVDFLRGKAGPKIRLGILNGKRVEYFKGASSFFILYSCGHAGYLWCTIHIISNRENGCPYIT